MSYPATLGASDAAFLGGLGRAARRAARGISRAAKKAARVAQRSGALDLAVSAVPGGPLARGALTAGSAVIRGERLDRALVRGATSAVPGGPLARIAAQKLAAPLARTVVREVTSGRSRPGPVRPLVLGPATGARGTSRLPSGARVIAGALLRRAELRRLPAGQLGRKFATSPAIAAMAIAAIVTVVRTGRTPDPSTLPVPAAEAVRAAMGASLDRLLSSAGRASWAPSPDAGALAQDETGRWLYTVEPGDLPYKIAQAAGKPVAELFAANPGKPLNAERNNFRTLSAGEVLNWPPGWPVPDNEDGETNPTVDALLEQEAAILQELMGLYAQRAQLGETIARAQAAGDAAAASALSAQRDALSSGPIRQLEARLVAVRNQLGDASVLANVVDELPPEVDLPVLDREVPPEDQPDDDADPEDADADPVDEDADPEPPADAPPTTTAPRKVTTGPFGPPPPRTTTPAPPAATRPAGMTADATPSPAPVPQVTLGPAFLSDMKAAAPLLLLGGLYAGGYLK